MNTARRRWVSLDRWRVHIFIIYRGHTEAFLCVCGEMVVVADDVARGLVQSGEGVRIGSGAEEILFLAAM